MGRKATVIIVLIATALLLTSSTIPFKSRVNLHGGRFSTKSMSLWQLHKFRDTELLRKYPLCWCPYKSYVLVSNHVKIECSQNRNWLIIDTDLYNAVIEDAKYNKAHAKKYRGKTKAKIKKIYKYCYATAYVKHVKTARDVIEHRQGDCAGVASAFYVMCKKNRIPVRYVIGWDGNECHAWNRVKYKGKWYWIDPTLGLWLNREQYEGRTVMEMW